MSEADVEFVRKIMQDDLMLNEISRTDWARLFSFALRGAEAADTIAALRATNERLRGALERHVCDCKSNCAWERDETCPSWDARAALTQEKSNG
jgi:hypothetical protein